MVKIEWSRFKKSYLVNYPKKFRGSESINIFIYTHTLLFLLLPIKKILWQIAIYQPTVWLKFKLHNYGLKFDILPTWNLIEI